MSLAAYQALAPQQRGQILASAIQHWIRDDHATSAVAIDAACKAAGLQPDPALRARLQLDLHEAMQRVMRQRMTTD